jgi:hypothetical protein
LPVHIDTPEIRRQIDQTTRADVSYMIRPIPQLFAKDSVQFVIAARCVKTLKHLAEQELSGWVDAKECPMPQTTFVLR